MIKKIFINSVSITGNNLMKNVKRGRIIKYMRYCDCRQILAHGRESRAVKFHSLENLGLSV